jgi:hypothetical protein
MAGFPCRSGGDFPFQGIAKGAMARTPAKVAKYTRAECLSQGFSAAAIARFRRLCLSPKLIRELAVIASAHLAPRPRPTRASPRTRAELRKTLKALERLLERLENLSSPTQHYLERDKGSLGALIGEPTCSSELEATRVQVARAVPKLEQTIMLMKTPTGSPLDHATRDLAISVTVVLQRHGIKCTMSRAGTFAQVLEELLFELYENAPTSDSLLPYLQFAARHLEGMSNQMLGRLFDLACTPGVSVASAVWRAGYDARYDVR